MGNDKTGDEKMISEAVQETIVDYSQVLSLRAVHNYTDAMVERGRAEYNKGSILVRSLHPLDQCLKRGIIEEEHYQIGKRLRNYRDCALSKLSGRTYNATGEGDSEMDAGTIYANVMRSMNGTPGGKNEWKLINIVCFAEPNLDGRYYSEGDYGMLYRLAPNIQAAFEVIDKIIYECREAIKKRIEAANLV